MAFKDDLLRLSVQISERRIHVTNEETTKHSLIIPFIQVLGYDIFNPLEVQPEYVADFGLKRGEKIDYAIFKNGAPIIFVEAKSVGEKLDNHNAQLSRYFNSTPNVKIGILTNGIIYKFFTDLQQNNIMDISPFYEINITDLKDQEIEAFSRFRKEVFENEELIKYAEELVYMASLNKTLRELLKNPTDEFVRFLIKDFSNLRATGAVIERFKPLVKKAVQSSLLEIVSQGILNNNEDQVIDTIQLEAAAAKDAAIKEVSPKEVITTEEELAIYDKIIAILSSAGKDTSQIKYKDTVSYFAVLQRNTYGWFIRFNIESNFKYILSKLPLEITQEISNGLKAEAAPKGLGESRIILNSFEDIKLLTDFIIKSFEIVEDF